VLRGIKTRKNQVNELRLILPALCLFVSVVLKSEFCFV